MYYIDAQLFANRYMISDLSFFLARHPQILESRFTHRQDVSVTQSSAAQYSSGYRISRRAGQWAE
jgi:hypothetical protein